MGANRSKGLKEERASKMHDTNRDDLDHSDNAGLKVATEKTPVISGITGTTRNFLAAVKGTLS